MHQDVHAVQPGKPALFELHLQVQSGPLRLHALLQDNVVCLTDGRERMDKFVAWGFQKNGINGQELDKSLMVGRRKMDVVTPVENRRSGLQNEAWAGLPEYHPRVVERMLKVPQ